MGLSMNDNVLYKHAQLSKRPAHLPTHTLSEQLNKAIKYWTFRQMGISFHPNLFCDINKFYITSFVLCNHKVLYSSFFTILF